MIGKAFLLLLGGHLLRVFCLRRIVVAILLGWAIDRLLGLGLVALLVGLKNTWSRIGLVFLNLGWIGFYPNAQP